MAHQIQLFAAIVIRVWHLATDTSGLSHLLLSQYTHTTPARSLPPLPADLSEVATRYTIPSGVYCICYNQPDWTSPGPLSTRHNATPGQPALG
jgi:hypothetical protein